MLAIVFIVLYMFAASLRYSILFDCASIISFKSIFNQSKCIVKSSCKEETNAKQINLSVVACGDRVPETLTLLKSALMFTEIKLYFYIFTEAHLKNEFVKQASGAFLFSFFFLLID